MRPSEWRFRPSAHGGALELVLREGRTRVVRRLAEALGLGVRSLVRTQYGPVSLGTLERGRSRRLDARETAAVYAAIGLPLPLSLTR